MKKRKKKLLLILIIISIFTLTSCSKYQELNHLSIISTITIEYKNNKYHLTLEEILPKKEDNKVGYKYKYHTSSSKSLNKAFSNILDNSPKDIYLEKVQNIIISHNNYQEISKEFFTYINTNKSINKNSNYLISTTKVKDILKVSNDYNYLSSILKKKKKTLNTLSKSKNKKIPVIKLKDKEIVFIKYETINL